MVAACGAAVLRQRLCNRGREGEGGGGEGVREGESGSDVGCGTRCGGGSSANVQDADNHARI
jgi:hypothetical protein